MIITFIEFDAFLPVLMTLILFQGHIGNQRCKIAACNFSESSFTIMFKLCMIVEYTDKITPKLLFVTLVRIQGK